MKKILLGFCLLATTVAIADAGSDLYNEFLRRDQLKLTQEEGVVIQFLKSLQYNTQNVIEMDLLNPKTTFVFRDRGGDICYGDVMSQILRCKNEIGLTGVSYQGDAD
jgi:hypothetical protein